MLRDKALEQLSIYIIVYMCRHPLLLRAALLVGFIALVIPTEVHLPF